jgi:hypothetical protein
MPIPTAQPNNDNAAQPEPTTPILKLSKNNKIFYKIKNKIIRKIKIK